MLTAIRTSVTGETLGAVVKIYQHALQGVRLGLCIFRPNRGFNVGDAETFIARTK